MPRVGLLLGHLLASHLFIKRGKNTPKHSPSRGVISLPKRDYTSRKWIYNFFEFDILSSSIKKGLINLENFYNLAGMIFSKLINHNNDYPWTRQMSIIMLLSPTLIVLRLMGYLKYLSYKVWLAIKLFQFLSFMRFALFGLSFLRIILDLGIDIFSLLAN